MKEMVGGCCVCSDERGWPDNPLVYCDGNGCTVAVHQACYGIVTVPTGPWYCRKCESPETKGKVRCELCPSRSGALKRSDTGGWAHVVCALYIPEVRFGNVTSMEPIVLRLIPSERYNKTCYICQDLGKPHRATAGACMQCNKSGCKQQFHVTCAQSLGLLCEEAGNYLDNVKYCGYCQHHYSKLKKGGNVKTIPPYKPVSHDSHSSDSSGEKEATSPARSGAGTPTHAKSKGPGRKSSHSSSTAPGKNTPTAAKTPTPAATQPSDKKKPSPSRRGSSASDAPGSKGSTPAPSPQHPPPPDPPASTKGGGPSSAGSSKIVPPASPSAAKPGEPASVISSVAAASGAPTATITAPPTNTSTATSVVQTAPKATYQESVITNTDAVDTKHTKKRKAITAANTADFGATPPPAPVPSEPAPQAPAWDGSADVPMDPAEKVVKKAKTEGPENIPLPPGPPLNYSQPSPAPPPPAHVPTSLPSPRHHHSPMPGPSGLNQSPNIRSPSQHQVSASSEMPAPASAPHIFHQPQKQAAMEPSIPGQSPHARAQWGGLNVAYEMQQDHNKPGVSGVAGPGKDAAPMPPTNHRHKKRAAIATSVVSMANPPLPPPTQMSGTQTNMRRQPQPTPPPPPPLYQDSMKDSPPSSPSSDRPLKPKMESRLGGSYSAPHMLGNELNPESGAAARLQEQLTAELAAHAASGASAEPPVPPPLFNKASGSGGSGRGSSGAQSLDQLLERQWEQGSQFLMEQAQHFDIASLLSCLHQLRTENVRLEEHVANLLQRRDHLLAVNARLAIPLTAATVSTAPPDPPRCPRENGSQARAPPPPPPVRTETITSERAHQLVMREVQKPS